MSKLTLDKTPGHPVVLVVDITRDREGFEYRMTQSITGELREACCRPYAEQPLCSPPTKVSTSGLLIPRLLSIVCSLLRMAAENRRAVGQARWSGL